MGHVSNITVKDEGVGAEYDWYRDLAFYYTTAGRLWRVLWDRWALDGQEQVADYEKLSAKEFYYDNARARYLARDVDPNNDWQPIGDWRWTDYAGMQPYGDFTTDANHAISEDKRYLSESGARVEQTVSTAATRYLHGDLLDSTMLATDAGGTAVSAVSYTAFGEPIGDPSQLGTRYGYAGGWGYESDLLTLGGAPNTAPISLQHVGARWYQPNIGRFVQRDPIGFLGGLNLYGYCIDNPLSAIDPSGLTFVVNGPGPARWIVNWTGGTTGSNWWSDFWDNRSTINADNVGKGAAVVGFTAAAGALVLYCIGVDVVLWGGAMKVGQLTNPQPIPVSPPTPAWDWWDEWMNDPQWWL